MPKPKNAKSAPKPKGKPKSEEQGLADIQVERTIIYPEIQVNECYGEAPLTAELAEGLLLWTEESDILKFGEKYDFKDENGAKICCLHNQDNRPLSMPWVKTLVQDILNRNWKFNGETIVIGKTGRVLSGQHRLIALCLAEQQRTGKQKKHWEWDETTGKGWKDQVYIETIVVCGVDEEPSTTRTLDNVKPRSFADVLFCDRSMLDYAKTGAEREKLTRWVDHAIKTLWDRTLAKTDPFRPRRTHSEGLEFLDKHSHILTAVRHINDENKRPAPVDGKQSDPPLTKLLAGGYCVAMLYLMGTSQSDVDVYRHAEPPSEKQCDLSLWAKACEFWTLLAKGAAGPLKEVYYAILSLGDAEGKDTDTVSLGGTKDEIMSILAKGWKLFVDGETITKGDPRLALKYGKNKKTGNTQLEEVEDVGGIDLGGWKGEEPDTSEQEQGDEGSPELSPEEAERAKEEARKKRVAEVAAKLKEAREKKKGAKGQAANGAKIAVVGPNSQAELDAIKGANRGAVLLFRNGKGFKVWGDDDVTAVSKTLELTRRLENGMPLTEIPGAKADAAVEKIKAAGYPVVIVEPAPSTPATPATPPPAPVVPQQTNAPTLPNGMSPAAPVPAAKKPPVPKKPADIAK